MIKLEEARHHYNDQAVKTASNNNFDSDGVKYSASAIIDADLEQEIWEDYIRYGRTTAFPSKVIIA